MLYAIDVGSKAVAVKREKEKNHIKKSFTEVSFEVGAGFRGEQRREGQNTASQIENFYFMFLTALFRFVFLLSIIYLLCLFVCVCVC